MNFLVFLMLLTLPVIGAPRPWKLGPTMRYGMDESRVKGPNGGTLSGSSYGVGALLKRKFSEPWGMQVSAGIDQFRSSKNSSEIKVDYVSTAALGTVRKLVGSWEFTGGLGGTILYPVKKETNTVTLSSIKPTFAPTAMVSIGHLLRGKGPVLLIDYRHLPETNSVKSRSIGMNVGYVWTL